jgi:hypothetical protein
MTPEQSRRYAMITAAIIVLGFLIAFVIALQRRAVW